MTRSKSVNSSPRSAFRRMIPGFILGFLVILGLTLLGDLRQVSSHLLEFNWWLFPVVILLTLFNYALRFIKWHFYLGQIGIHSIRWHESLRLFIGGFPLAVTPGKVGEVFKGVWLNQSSGLPVGRGVSVVAAERVSDGLAVLLLSTLGVIAYPQYWPAFLIILCLLMAFVFLTQVRPVSNWILSQGDRLRFLQRYVAVAREFYEGSFTLLRPVAMLFAVGLGTISWLGEGIGFYLILLGLGMPPSTELMAMAIFILSFSTLIGAVSALPGGLGAAEVSIAGMLTLLVGMPPAVAATATLLIRLATLWFGVILGLLVWAISPKLLGIHNKHDAMAEG